jgi:hypothetical protein
MNVGFTGTQRGMTASQWLSLFYLLRVRGPDEFHEGDCDGSDAQAAFLARHVGFRIIGHPPDNDAKRAFFPADEWREPLPYLERNHKIVLASQEMIATPGEFEEVLRSGTWATIRYARRVGRPLHVIYPDGLVVS